MPSQSKFTKEQKRAVWAYHRKVRPADGTWLARWLLEQGKEHPQAHRILFLLSQKLIGWGAAVRLVNAAPFYASVEQDAQWLYDELFRLAEQEDRRARRLLTELYLHLRRFGIKERPRTWPALCDPERRSELGAIVAEVTGPYE